MIDDKKEQVLETVNNHEVSHSFCVIISLPHLPFFNKAFHRGHFWEKLQWPVLLMI